MRVLIFAFLAVAVSATSDPSWVRNRFTYPYYNRGGYGIYGTSYGSDYGYGSGLGYGSSIGYGSGLGYGSSIGYGTGLGYGSSIGYGSGIGYGGHYSTAYKPAVYQTARHSDGAVYGTGYSQAAPGKISFTLGGTGYQTGPSVVSGSEKWRSPAVSRPGGMFRQRTATAHRSGVAAVEAPGIISFTQDFSRLSGNSNLHRTQGVAGISTSRKTVAPVPVVTEEHPAAIAGNTGSSIKTATLGTGGVSEIHFQEIAGGYGSEADGLQGVPSPVSAPLSRPSPSGFDKNVVHTLKTTVARPQTFTFEQAFSKVPALRPEGRVFDKVTAPITTVVAPKRSYGVGTAHRSSQGMRATSGQPHMSFTQDFSRVSGHSDIKPEIHRRVITPVRTVVAQKVPTGSISASRTILKSGAGGIRRTGGYLQGGLPQDFSKGIGQSGMAALRPEIHSYEEISVPIRTAVSHRVPSRPYGSSGAIRRSGFLGGIGGLPQINFVQGFSGTRGQSQQFGVKPEALSFGKGQPAPVVRTVIPPSSGNRVETFPRTTQSFPPSRISFTQDFSRIANRQTSGIVSPHDNVPAFPGTIPSHGYQAIRKNTLASSVGHNPVTEKRVLKAPKQTVVQQPAFTTFHDQQPVQGISSGPVGGHGIADRSSFVSEPAVGFVRDHVTQEITTVDGHGGEKLSNVLFGVVHDRTSSTAGGHNYLGNTASPYKASSIGHGGDKSNIYAAVPVDPTDKSSALLHSTGVKAPTGGFVEASHFGQGYSVETTPFKKYFSSSYPGYSHVSGESPRFEFSPDRSLLYTYSSPYLASPFSYTYSTGKGEYNQAHGKSIA